MRARGGELPPRREDDDRGVPALLSAGYGLLTRAAFDRAGHVALRRMNGGHLDVTVVEPDGTVTEIVDGHDDASSSG